MISHTKNIDEDTGQVISERKVRINVFDEEKGYLFWNRKNSVRIFQEQELPSSLTKNDLANLFLLSKRVYSNTNMLAYRGNGGIKPLNIPRIAKVIRESERRATTFVNHMIKLRIIARAEITVGDKMTTQYYLNPIYFFSAKRLTLNLYLLFQEELDLVIPVWVKKRFVEQRNSEVRRD